MKRTVAFFFNYFLFWFLFFVVFKVLFLLANFSDTAQLTWRDLFGVFLHGSRMDLSVAGYFTMLPGILLALSPLIKTKITEGIIKWYTFALLVIVTAMGLTDMGLYPAWGCRLNAQILPYFANLKGMLDCVSWWQAILIIVIEVGLVWGAFFCYKKIFRTRRTERGSVKWTVFPVLMLLSGALILPIRSSLSTAPLNFSSVYFSEKPYANHCAYNFFWSFSYALTNNKAKVNPVHYMDQQACDNMMKHYEQLNQEQPPIYIRNKSGKPVNVILVILESFSNKIIEPLGGLSGITPRFNEFCKEGILFSSFYSTGNRSDKGISSLIATYPALMKASSILFFPDKMKNLDCLPTYFSKRNYDMSFFYAGDVNFYNKRMLMMQSGVNKIVTENNFPSNISGLQKWGVPDNYLYDRMYKDLAKSRQPFFSIVYNISSHEPYDIPSYKKIPGNSNRDKYLNAISYCDSCLGHFIDRLKNSPLWENTLVVITSDHTSLEPGPTTVEEPATYRIPLLWIGGVIDTSFVEKNISMQTDLSATLVQQMGWKPKPSFFSKNIFGSKQYAFYFRDEGWGFLSPEIGVFTNLESKQQHYFYGKQHAAKDSLNLFSKAFTQFLHADFLKR
jgi:phosphoglycerol transferase MdoB-like AlkP superfamily enzyme